MASPHLRYPTKTQMSLLAKGADLDNGVTEVTAATYTITEATDGLSRTFFGAGASALVAFTLPTPVVGMKYRFINKTAYGPTITTSATSVHFVGQGANDTHHTATMHADIAAYCGTFEVVAISTTQWLVTVNEATVFAERAAFS